MTKTEQNAIQNKMLIDFMFDGNEHSNFLTDEQWWNVFDMANGVIDIRETPQSELTREMISDHILKSSLELKKRMTNYILDLISVFGLVPKLELEPEPQPQLG